MKIARHFVVSFSIALIFTILSTPSFAQPAYQPSPENLQARREFQDMKLPGALTQSVRT